MSLVQPLLLLLAVAGAVALILAYYLRRRQAPRVFFSAVRFLPEASRARTARAALPPLRLLLLLAVLVSGTLSLAQPMLARTQPAPLGLIIDDTAFGGSGDLRRIGLALARRISEAPWALFTTSGSLVAAGAGERHLVAVLESYSRDSGSAAYSPAVFRQAAGYLKERAGSAPTLFLVGSQETLSGYPGLGDLRTELEKDGSRLLSISSERSARTVFIAGTDVPHLARLGGEVRTRIGIANTGTAALTGELRLISGDKVLNKTPVSLPGRSLTWQELSTTLRSNGQTQYQVVVSAGEYHDQVAWAPVAFPAQKTLVVASPGSSPGYIEKALKASPLVDAVTIVDPAALTVPRLRDFLASTRLAVLDGVDAPALPADVGSELKGWVESGGTLVFTSGPKVSESWNKSALAPVLPAVLKLRRDKVLQEVTVRDHPVTRNLELESSALAVSQWSSVDTPPAENVLVSIGGEPMLIARKAKQGTTFLWKSTSDPRWNNWAQHPSFPAFWSNVLMFAVSGDVKTVSSTPDGARSLWRSAANASKEKVYYVDAVENRPVDFPTELLAELERPAKSYQVQHLPFLIASLLLVLACLWGGTMGRRRE